MTGRTWNEKDALELARRCVSRELPPRASVCGDDEDLVKCGLIDSMGWVGILSAIEEAAAIRNFGNPWPKDRPQSIQALARAVLEGAGRAAEQRPVKESVMPAGTSPTVGIAGWGHVLGCLKVDAATIEQECGVAPGTIRDRAGIESVRRAGSDQDELSLGQQAAESALDTAKLELDAVDLLVATSATWLRFPSLAASLHTRLLLPESCAALDVGGACAGVVYALMAAKSLLCTASRNVALVVASEVNSRRLAHSQAPGAFRGLFGDAACALVLTRSASGDSGSINRLGDFVCGCSGTFASALELSLAERGQLDVEFKGKQLASAALGTLDRVLSDLETAAGKPRSAASYFALHEPNPRVVEIFAQRAGIRAEKIAMVSRTSGNLGSATCGVSLCTALTRAQRDSDNSSAPSMPLIFVAAVGPGLVWAGTYTH